ncbi:hypothetical protein GCM10023331_00880 [Algivirga pacifica]|uniref:Prealbumin-like fold domain-containing protein n=2 Tax=Algivirga pacifica TaxID=1162670 RepID=A0ABP9CZE3_9BACT
MAACKSSSGKTKNTMLVLKVLDEVGNPVEGAQVFLYPTEQALLLNEVGIKAEELSNEKGKVSLVNDIEPVAYYITAQKDSLSTSAAGVKTDTLQKWRVNKLNVVLHPQKSKK